MSIHYISSDLPDLTGQYIFISSIVINTCLSPLILKKCQSKQNEILNPMINSSYSQISIWILLILKVSTWVVIFTNVINILATGYYQIVTAPKHGGSPDFVLKNLYTVTGFLNQLILFVQVYEWLIVIHSIMYYNGKSMLQILNAFKDPTKVKKFQRDEDKIKWIVILLTLVCSILYVFAETVYNFFYVDKYPDVYYFAQKMFPVCDILQIVALVCSGSFLLFVLKQRFPDEFKIQKNAIIVFMITETFINLWFIYVDSMTLIFAIPLRGSDYGTSDYTISFTGLRNPIQAYGFLYLKRSRDPLEDIQQLQQNNMVSKVQKLTKQYMTKLQTNWSSLTEQDQNYLTQAYLDKMGIDKEQFEIEQMKEQLIEVPENGQINMSEKSQAKGFNDDY